MKALILSCSTGGGHNTCAKYIKEEFNKYNISATFTDYFSIIGENASKMAENVYLTTTKGNGSIFKGFYKLGETYSKTKIPSPVYLLNKLAKNKLSSYIEQGKYDVIIATHLFPAMATSVIKETNNKIKLINVATDYTAIPFWEETKPDYFVIPHSSLKEEFISKGFKEEILLPLGIPVISSFNKIKPNIKISHNKKIILVTSGSMGFGKMKEIITSLLNNIDNIYIIAICGNNEKLYQELINLNNSNILVKGYINNMDEYMKISDVILTKPGGLTSTEVAIMHKPLVHIMPIPGVENYNSEFFFKNGLSLVSNTIDEIISNTKELLNNKELQNKMILKQKEIINENSAKYLVEFIIKNIGKEGL